MDVDRFDTILTALTTAPSRRAALRFLAGLMLVGLVGQTEAKKKHKKKKDCPPCKKKKKGKCKKSLPDGSDCPGGTCQGGICLPSPAPPVPPPPACVPRTCQSHPCGSFPDGCGGTLVCGCPANHVCVGSVCQPCTVVDGVCKPCITVDGICQPCTVSCPSANPFTCGNDLQAAMNAGGTVYVCPGRYARSYLLTDGVHVIGAGPGTDDTRNTILDASELGNRVLEIKHTADLVELERLRITGGNVASIGAGITHDGTMLRMTDYTVSGNTTILSTGGGGVFTLASSTLDMLRCTISDNHATGTEGNVGSGGGIFTNGPATLTDCLIEGNSAGNGGGLYATGTTILAGSTEVRGNTATRGGGIVNIGTLQIAETCRVTHNTAAAVGDGGGIINDVLGTVTLDGASPSPIVVDNCHDNCVGPVSKCAETPVSCPP